MADDPNAPPPVPGLDAGDRARLAEVLERSRDLGFLGPGPVAAHIERSLALLPLLWRLAPPGAPDGPAPAGAGAHDGVPPAAPGVPARQISALDLGSGGGVPGLPLALATPRWRWVLLDGSVTRTAWLREAVDALRLGTRVEVATARAEDAGRTHLRGAVDLVTARGFAAAAPTAECAAPLLRIGGAVVVTEPPGGAPDRWPAPALAELGLAPGASVATPVALQSLRKVAATPERFPRRVGIPVKRPLW